MYLFGGHSVLLDNWLNCLFCLDLSTFVWKDLSSTTKCEPTKPLRSDKCVSWSHKGKFFIFGGYGSTQVEHMLQLLDRQEDFQLSPDFRWQRFGWNNQLVQFNPEQNSWNWPSYSGRCPSARAAHSGALLGDKYYVFGGRDMRQRLNDLYVLDLQTFQWTQIAASLDIPVEHPISHLTVNRAEEQAEFRNESLPNNVSLRVENRPEEEPTPSPSTSANYQMDEDLSSESSSSSQSCQNDAGQVTDDEETDDDEEDDGDDDVLDHVRCSSWSPRSSVSSSSQLDGANREHPPTIELTLPGQLTGTSTIGLEQHKRSINAAVQRKSSDERINLRPIGRSFATFTPVSETNIILYGGISTQDKNLEECWVYNTQSGLWSQIDCKQKQSRIWHTASRSKINEVIIIGGSSSTDVDEFCPDVVSLSLEPKSLRRLALDASAKSIPMRTIQRVERLPETTYKLIKLRKQAMAITMKRSRPVLV